MSDETHRKQGRIQDFKLGGAHLKKLRLSPLGAKNIGVFRVKNHIFSNFRGARAGCPPPPPLDPPLEVYVKIFLSK